MSIEYIPYNNNNVKFNPSDNPTDVSVPANFFVPSNNPTDVPTLSTLDYIKIHDEVQEKREKGEVPYELYNPTNIHLIRRKYADILPTWQCRLGLPRQDTRNIRIRDIGVISGLSDGNEIERCKFYEFYFGTEERRVKRKEGYSLEEKAKQCGRPGAGIMLECENEHKYVIPFKCGLFYICDYCARLISKAWSLIFLAIFVFASRNQLRTIFFTLSGRRFEEAKDAVDWVRVCWSKFLQLRISIDRIDKLFKEGLKRFEESLEGNKDREKKVEKQKRIYEKFRKACLDKGVKKVRDIFFAGARRFEFTIGDDGLFYPHIHIVCCCIAPIPQVLLSMLWELISESYVVDIREVKQGKEKVAAYAASGYLSKKDKDSKRDKDKDKKINRKLLELQEATRGLKHVRKFGFEKEDRLEISTIQEMLKEELENNNKCAVCRYEGINEVVGNIDVAKVMEDKTGISQIEMMCKMEKRGIDVKRLGFVVMRKGELFFIKEDDWDLFQDGKGIIARKVEISKIVWESGDVSIREITRFSKDRYEYKMVKYEAKTG